MKRRMEYGRYQYDFRSWGICYYADRYLPSGSGLPDEGKNALRAGLTVGIGFTGISLAISLVSDNLGGLVKAMQANWGLALDITDVGWPAASGIAFRKRNLCAGFHRDIPYSQCDLPGN